MTNLQYALTPVGRTVWENGIPKEEFFVKDHLGNVRSVVEVGQMNFVDYLGSYELASANLENLVFDFHGDIRDEKPGSLNPLNLKTGRLNGAEEDRRIGTALLLKMMAGDRVELNADNYYENYMPGSDDDLVNAEDLLENILTVLSGGAGGFEGGEIHNPGFVNELFHPANFMTAEGMLRADEDPQRPKAYLNYILFDEQMEIVSTFTGSFQANGNDAWQEIGTTTPMEIPANGYLAVYLSNQSRPTGCHVCGDVFFDKVKVRFSQGKLKEETHHYPFGLPMGNAGSTASNFLPNRRKYQSNEYIKDLNLNWMDFNFRQYDPQLGRFLSVDPLAASGGQDRLSPYAAMGNQPEFAVDPEGLLPNVFTKAGGAGMGDFEGGFAEGSLALRAPWQDENSLFFSVGGGGSWTENAYAKFIVDYANWVAKLELKRQNGDAAKKDSPARNYEEESNAQQAWVDFFNGGGNISISSGMAWFSPPEDGDIKIGKDKSAASSIMNNGFYAAGIIVIAGGGPINLPADAIAGAVIMGTAVYAGSLYVYDNWDNIVINVLSSGTYIGNSWGWMMAQGRGERGKTAKPSGTNNPYKHLSPDSTNPKRVIDKAMNNGRGGTRAKPEGFDRWWNNKHNKR